MSGELPKGWATTTFSEILDFKGGSQPPKAEFSEKPLNGYIRLLQIRDFESDEKAVYIKNALKWPKCSIGDIMIGRYGASVGKVLSGKAGAYNVALVKVIFDDVQLERRWVFWFLKSEFFQRNLRTISRSAQDGFNKEDLANAEIALPPTAEQHRIATKIDSLFARSSRARDELAHIPKLIDRYRQAVLEAAFRGDLTADWRRQSASAQWEKVAAKDLFKWGSGKNLPKNAMQEGDYPVYGGNGVNGCHSEANSFAPTIIVGRVGALCGNVYVSTGPCWVTDNAIYATSVSARVRLRFAQLAFTFARLNERAGGSGQPFVSQQILNDVVIPLPSVEEQDEIVRTFETSMGAVGSIMEDHASAIALMNRLDQSILDKAFSGKLVPQDPADEPASKLLERIRAERAAAPKAKRGRKPKV